MNWDPLSYNHKVLSQCKRETKQSPKTKRRSFLSFCALNPILLLSRPQCETCLSPAQAQDQPLQKRPEQYQRDSVGDTGRRRRCQLAAVFLQSPGQMRRRRDAPLTDEPFYRLAKCEVLRLLVFYYCDAGGVLVRLHEMQKTSCKNN